MSPTVNLSAAQQQHIVCMGDWWLVVDLPIMWSLQTHIEKLCCDNKLWVLDLLTHNCIAAITVLKETISLRFSYYYQLALFFIGFATIDNYRNFSKQR